MANNVYFYSFVCAFTLVNQHQPSNFARLGGLALANILSGEARYGYETLAPWVPWSWMMLDVYSPSHMIVSQVLTHTHITCQNLVNHSFFY